MTTETLGIGTVVSDLQQRIVYTDDRYCEIVGRDRRQVIGHQALSFTYQADLPVNQPRLDKLAQNGPGFTIIKRYVRGDGTLVWVRNHVTRFTDSDGKPLLCATTEEVQRPFGDVRLARNYETVRLLCAGLKAGRRQLSSDLVSAPTFEALLWLYRAEAEGTVQTVELLAALTGSANAVMVRWMTVLRDRSLIEVENADTLNLRSRIRISLYGERKVDAILARMAIAV